MTRMKKATGKETKLANSLAKGRKPPAEETQKERLTKIRRLLQKGERREVAEKIVESPGLIPFFTQLLLDEKEEGDIRVRAADALGEAALHRKIGTLDEKGAAEVITAFGKALSTDDVDVLEAAVAYVTVAAERKADISKFVAGLVNALWVENEELWSRAQEALGIAINTERNHDAVVSALIQGFFHVDERVRERAHAVLEDAIVEADKKIRTTITIELLRTIRSDSFIKEMEKNSSKYTNAMEIIERVFQQLKETEVAQQ